MQSSYGSFLRSIQEKGSLNRKMVSLSAEITLRGFLGLAGLTYSQTDLRKGLWPAEFPLSGCLELFPW